VNVKAHFSFFLLALAAFPGFGKEKPEKPLFTWDLLWTGYYYSGTKDADEDFSSAEDLFYGGTLYNRGNLDFGIPRLDLSLRFLATDKRILPPVDDDKKAGFNPGFGIYHSGSGSRFLYGVQSEYGLSARLNNVWLRGIPFMESRSLSTRDLKTEPAAKDESEAYLYLGLPRNILPGFDAFAATAMDNDKNFAFSGGLGLEKNEKEFRLEGFYTGKELPERKASSWFSAAPPLPERDFSIYALGFIYNSPIAAFATDWAWSQTYAWGEGLYGNFAFRLGDRPWRFSLAGDGAEGRFADRSGAAAGTGFRLAAKGERFWPRSGLLSFRSDVRAAGIGESFSRGNASVYFRPSAPTAAEKRNASSIFRFTRASLSASRDARKPLKTADSINALAGFSLGPISSAFTFSYRSLSSLEEENLFQFPAFENFDSFKVSGELGWKPPELRIGAINPKFDLKARLGYTIRAKKDPLWELSFNGSIKPAKWGRIGLKIASTDFPDKWNFTLSWRFEMKLP
jgi:hypothetical protein